MASPTSSTSPGRWGTQERALIEAAVEQFGRQVSAKLWPGVGSREDHLRAPSEQLVHRMGEIFGLSVVSFGETRLKALSVRPDYAVDVGQVRVGYVELKQPGRGVPPNWPHPTGHDREQFAKLSMLPNVLYSDGFEWALFHYGTPYGGVARLASDFRSPDSEFTRVVYDFLTWKPERPRTVEELVRTVARLCRLLRDEVAEVLRQESRGEADDTHFTRLAGEWRELLFPRLTDAEFPDAYAQAVTFALLLARVDGIDFTGRSAGEIARLLGKKHLLMGTALDVMVHGPFEERSIVVQTLIRVVGAVQWEDFDRDTYLYLYEKFLEAYDPELRKRTGAYYTPRKIVAFMTGFVDELLRTHLGRPLGFAAKDVLVVDPGMGTGSFLTEVIDRVAATVEEEEGAGQVQPRLRALAERLIGFENQVGAYAVAELRVHEAFKHTYHTEIPDTEVRFLTDTLDDPALQEFSFGQMYDALNDSRKGANRIKRELPVMVVLSNPPYRERAMGCGPWLEVRGGDGHSRPNLDAFRAFGMGRYEHKLANLYVFFWRWATWKAFDAHPENPAGIVAFITPSSYTTGPGFTGMREYLRRTTDEGWIVDLTPEGHQPPVETRVFPGNQQPICIGVFLRRGVGDPHTPALVHYTQVDGAQRQKLDALSALRPSGTAWQACMHGWPDPFRPQSDTVWMSFPTVADLMPWAAPGVKPNRTWVYAPEPQTLRARWARLVGATTQDMRSLLKETRNTTVTTTPEPLAGQPARRQPLSEEQGAPSEPVRVGYRSFDRQWVIPDSRLQHMPSPDLWRVRGPAQIFATEPNITPGLLRHLGSTLRREITAEDLLAYVACVTAHPGYTARFQQELRVPGIRIPLTADRAVFTAAVETGREVLWLHTYGERCADAAAGRALGSPRMATHERPRVTVTIPDTSDLMPDQIDHDGESRTLHIGAGAISPVSPDVWEYHVSGMRIVRKWFGYRKKNPSTKRSSALNDIRADSWTADMTGELLDLLNVLGRCVALEPVQQQLLDAVLTGPLITVTDLREAGVLPVGALAKKPPRRGTSDAPWLTAP